jgi:hypothetical protein
VTANVKDFPSSLMDRFGIRVVTPDDLLVGLARKDLEAMSNVVATMTAAFRNPPRTREGVLAMLAKSGAPRFAATRGLTRSAQ